MKLLSSLLLVFICALVSAQKDTSNKVHWVNISTSDTIICRNSLPNTDIDAERYQSIMCGADSVVYLINGNYTTRRLIECLFVSYPDYILTGTYHTRKEAWKQYHVRVKDHLEVYTTRNNFIPKLPINGNNKEGTSSTSN